MIIPKEKADRTRRTPTSRSRQVEQQYRKGIITDGERYLGLLGAAPLMPGYAWGVTALAACATGGVILDILAGGSWVTGWLESGWLVRIGWISYGRAPVPDAHGPAERQFGDRAFAGRSHAVRDEEWRARAAREPLSKRTGEVTRFLRALDG